MTLAGAFYFNLTIIGDGCAPRVSHCMDKPTTPTPLWTTNEVMRFLGRSRNTICAWVRTGKLPAIRMPDGGYMFDPSIIGDWLHQRTTKP